MRARSLILLSALALVACTGNSTGLSGAGSMVIEVEVYKGPLSNDVPVQIGELRTVVDETARTLLFWYQKSGLPFGCVNPNCNEAKNCFSLDCLALQEAQEAALDILRQQCQLREYVKSKINHTRSQADQCTEDNVAQSFIALDDADLDLSPKALQPYAPEIARRLSQLAGDMKSKGFRITDHLITYVPRDPKVRSLLANLDLILSEYSNQIQARVGVLDKQFAALDSDGRTDQRKRLPVGDYLRDASPTDFIHLFQWFNAGDSGPDTPGQLSVEERVRMAERLFADYYWEKINEVYTSGQGDVNMAFIKNDIGNWDLKSFSNDPAKLVAAYRKAADAAISAGVDLATGGGSKGLRTGQQLIDLGNRIATGETSAKPNLGVLDAAALHGRTLSKLSTRRTAYAEQEAKLQAAKTAANDAVTAAEGEAKTKAEELGARQTTVDNADQQAADCQRQHPSDADTQCAGVIDARESARGGLATAQSAKMAADADLNSKKLAAEKAAADLTALRKAAQKDIRDILDDHLALIAMLQEAVAGSTQPAAPGTTVVPAVPALPTLPISGQSIR